VRRKIANGMASALVVNSVARSIPHFTLHQTVSLSSNLSSATTAGLTVMKSISPWIFSASAFVIEFGILSHQYWNSHLTVKQYFKKVVISLCSNATCVVSASIGAFLGTLVFPGIGTVLGALIFALITPTALEKLVEWVTNKTADGEWGDGKQYEILNEINTYKASLDFLQVTETTSPESIIEKKKLNVLLWHPDKYSGIYVEEATQKFMKTLQSFEIIKNYRTNRGLWELKSPGPIKPKKHPRKPTASTDPSFVSVEVSRSTMPEVLEDSRMDTPSGFVSVCLGSNVENHLPKEKSPVLKKTGTATFCCNSLLCPNETPFDI